MKQRPASQADSQQQFWVKNFRFGKMSAQPVQVMVRVTGNTFQVPLRVRSGRPGNSLRSDSPGRYFSAAPKRH
jgi:hypothetical protein